MLGLERINFLDKLRREEEGMEWPPACLGDLMVTDPHQLSFFALFLPIKKWSDLCIYESIRIND